jgi:hypothetical protein
LQVIPVFSPLRRKRIEWGFAPRIKLIKISHSAWRFCLDGNAWMLQRQ